MATPPQRHITAPTTAAAGGGDVSDDSWDALSSTGSNGDRRSRSTSSTASSYDVVTATRLAGADGSSAQKKQKNSPPTARRSVEASVMMAEEFGVPNFIRDWWAGNSDPTSTSAKADDSSSSAAAPRRATDEPQEMTEPAWSVAPPVQDKAAAALASKVSPGASEDGSTPHGGTVAASRVWIEAAQRRASEFLRRKEEDSSASTAAGAADQQQLPSNTEEAANEEGDMLAAVGHSFSEDGIGWVLERILARRSTTVPVDEDEVYDEFDHDDPTEAIRAAQSQPRVASRRTKQTWLYHCQWQRRPEPTWEERGFMVDEGFGPELDWFDSWLQRGVPLMSGLPPLPPPSPRTATTALQARRQEDELQASAFLSRSDRQLHDMFNFNPATNENDFDAMFPIIGSLVQEEMGSDYTVHRIARIDHPRYNHRFGMSWKHAIRRQYEAVPALVFHGTRRRNVRSIIRRGLVVPGVGEGHFVKSSNGMVHGAGIYTSRVPSWSQKYCDYYHQDDPRQRRLMFACVGLVGTNDGAEYLGHMHVFARAQNILPVWLVEFSSMPARQGHEPEVVPMKMLLAVEAERAAAYREYMLQHPVQSYDDPDGVVAEFRRLQALRRRGKPEEEEDPGRRPGERRGVHVVDGTRVPGHYVEHGVRRGDIKGETKAVKELVRSGDLKVEKSKNRRSRRRGHDRRRTHDE